MSLPKPKPETMIATLGVEPQVVTIALDKLVSAGKNIQKVIVIHTEHPAIKEALSVLEKEFISAYPDFSLHAAAISGPNGYIKDLLSKSDLNCLLQTLYLVIRQERQEGRIIHLCISGGRKVMGVMAMVVAQLLFGPQDQVWYLITKGWAPGSNRHLHTDDAAQSQLVPVPVLRWREAGTLIETVGVLSDPQEVLTWYQRLTERAEEKRRDEFVKRWLTPAERQVARLACLGYSNAAIASELNKREQTVANQLGSIYEKLREWLDYPEYNVDRSVLIARFAQYFNDRDLKGD